MSLRNEDGLIGKFRAFTLHGRLSGNLSSFHLDRLADECERKRRVEIYRRQYETTRRIDYTEPLRTPDA